jgi:hypothetical protein
MSWQHDLEVSTFGPDWALVVGGVMALLAALVLFTHALNGFDNRQLVRLVGRFWDQPYSTREATYDLRRLRRKAMITRLPHSHHYQLTPLGRRVAVLFTKAHGRVLAPGLALLDPTLPRTSSSAARSPPPGVNSTGY